MDDLKVHLSGPEETKKLALVIASSLEKSVCIGLTGPLGSGKTTLCQGIAEGLGVLEQVSSPTFLMLNEYHSGKFPVYHFDLYRLQESFDPEGLSELKSELDEIMLSGKNIALVEWINLFPDFLSSYDELGIELSYEGQGRCAVFNARGPEARELLNRCQARLAEKEESTL